MVHIYSMSKIYIIARKTYWFVVIYSISEISDFTQYCEYFLSSILFWQLVKYLAWYTF